MWDDFYNWIEQYSGSSYNLSDDLKALRGDNIFIDPTEWKIKVNYIADELNDILDILEDHKRDLPDIFPSYNQLRNFIIGETLTSMIEAINEIKQKLNIEAVNINNVDSLSEHALNLYELVNTMEQYSLEQISKKDWFDEFEDDNDNFLQEQFGLAKNDLTNIHFIVHDIMQLHEEDE